MKVARTCASAYVQLVGMTKSSHWLAGCRNHLEASRAGATELAAPLCVMWAVMGR